MIIDLSTQLRDLEREVLTQDKPTFNEAGEVTGKKKEAVILGNLCKSALLQANEDDKADEKVTRFELSLRLAMAEGPELDLEAEDITLIKKLVGKMYAPLVVGQVYRLLEGKETGLEPKE